MQGRRPPRRGWLGAMLVLSLVGGVLVGAYVMSTPDAQRVPKELRRVKDRPGVLVADPGSERLKFNKRNIDVPEGQDARLFLINEFLKANPIAPAEAKAIGIDVRDRTAIVSFNEAFDQTYGSEDEALILNGILATLGQFTEIDRASFEINGKPMETLGNIDLTTPQAVIRAGQHEAVEVAS